MRGKLVKAIRREVYGDASIKAPRRYATEKETGVRFNLGLRARYQDMKHDIKAGMKKGLFKCKKLSSTFS